MLDSINIYILLGISAKQRTEWTQKDIANELFVSQASVTRTLQVAQEVSIYNPKRKRVVVRRLEDALVHGAQYFLTPKQGGEVRGMPTAWAAPPLQELLAVGSDFVPVWPDPTGPVRGISFQPLHPSVPQAAKLNPFLYELLALVDMLRIGGTRETKLAARELHDRLNLR